MFVSRLTVIISPVLALDNTDREVEYCLSNMVAVMFILCKTSLVVYYGGKRELNLGIERLVHPSEGTEALAAGILLGLDVYQLIQYSTKGDIAFVVDVIWALCCMAILVPWLNHIRRLKLTQQAIIILFHAFKAVYPFLFVVFMNFLIFAQLGQIWFGGKMTSTIPEDILKATKGPLLRNYEYQNFNDLYNGMVFLYTIEVYNNYPNMVNIAAIGRDPEHRDYSPLFFAVFTLINTFICQNILLGQIISITLDYFTAEQILIQQQAGGSVEEVEGSLREQDGRENFGIKSSVFGATEQVVGTGRASEKTGKRGRRGSLFHNSSFHEWIEGPSPNLKMSLFRRQNSSFFAGGGEPMSAGLKKSWIGGEGEGKKKKKGSKKVKSIQEEDYLHEENKQRTTN